MKHPDERVALQAVEFWSTVCEEEVELAIEAQEVCLVQNVVWTLTLWQLGSRIRRIS